MTSTCIAVTGAGGFVGSRVVAALRARGCAAVLTPSRRDCNLLDLAHTAAWVQANKPDTIIHCAAATGGIAWNAAHGLDAFRDNMLMILSLADAACAHGVSHVTHVSTSIAYPSHTQPPFTEDELWSGRPGGPTAGYAHAKRLGQVVLELGSRSGDLTAAVVMPANVYGSGARMDPDRANVVGAMVRRFVDAASRGLQRVECWGTGTPEREFIHVDDVAEGIVRATERVTVPEPINLGTGRMCSIRELAERVASAAEWTGTIDWDASRPDGVPSVCCDVSRMRSQLDWMPAMSLTDGLREMVDWYQGLAEKL
ncbi:MAG: NAD-dependent epimerase/dehydratase family protein [Phycisphaerales bacterium]|nr:NAD-dependent epimerase/dehydratase family protein [Phycisphaerales bacterium]